MVIAGPLDCNSSAVTCGPHSLHSNIQLGRFGCYMVKAVSVCMTAIKQICLILNINFFINIYKSSLWKNWEIKQWQIQGKGLGGPKTYPPPPPPSDLTLVWDWNLTLTGLYITISLADIFNEMHVTFCYRTKLLISVCLCSQSRISPHQQRPVFTDWEARGHLCEK